MKKREKIQATSGKMNKDLKKIGAIEMWPAPGSKKALEAEKVFTTAQKEIATLRNEIRGSLEDFGLKKHKCFDEYQAAMNTQIALNQSAVFQLSLRTWLIGAENKKLKTALDQLETKCKAGKMSEDAFKDVKGIVDAIEKQTTPGGGGNFPGQSVF